MLLLVFLTFSCKKEEKAQKPRYPQTQSTQTVVQQGKEIFEGKGNCFACHQADQKVIGPSISQIAKVYKEKNGDIPAFLKEESQPLVDRSQYAVMKTNFAITKNLKEVELKALEAYILSH